MNSKKMLVFLILSIMLAGLVVSCSPSETPEDVAPDQGGGDEAGSQFIESAPSNTSTPITTRLMLSKAPAVGEVVDLTLIFSSAKDAPDATATLTLPEDAEIVEGNLEWTGDLVAGEAHTLEVRFKFTSEGDKTLEGKALSTMEYGDVWADASFIYLNVTEEGGSEGFGTDDSRISTDSEESSP